MKGTGFLVLVGFLLQFMDAGALLDSEAFNTLFRGGLPIGDFDFSRIVQCTEDLNRARFDVPLVATIVPPTNISWLPEVPNYFQFPSGLDCINTNFTVMADLVAELQGINMDLQKLSRSEVDLGTVIGPMSDTRRQIFELCSTAFDDRTDIDNEFVIVDDTIIRTTNLSNVSSTPEQEVFFANNNIENHLDQINEMEDLFAAMRCGVLYRFVDLGPAFIPRFMVAGQCLQRNCSFPYSGGQTCRADLSAIGRLPGLRFDCCWRYIIEEDRFMYDCGFRRVNVPVLCDCDCDCPPRDVSTG